MLFQKRDRTAERETASALSALARIHRQTRNNSRTAENRSTPENLAEVVIGSETWHSTLPRVIIIG